MSEAAAGYTREQLMAFILTTAGCEPEEVANSTDFLIDSQLLVNQLRQAITGKDHLARLAGKLPAGDLKHDLSVLLHPKCTPGNEINAARIAQLTRPVADLLPADRTTMHQLSIILKKDAANPPDLSKYQKNVREGISALELLAATGQPGNMNNFIKSYQQYFEGQTLPLLVALDPEAGIGYQQAELEQNNPLLETFHMPSRKTPLLRTRGQTRIVSS